MYPSLIGKLGADIFVEWVGICATTPNNRRNYLAGNDAADTGDVAVSILDETPPGIPLARLPTAGLLDQLKTDHVLTNTFFTTVD